MFATRGRGAAGKEGAKWFLSEKVLYEKVSSEKVLKERVLNECHFFCFPPSADHTLHNVTMPSDSADIGGGGDRGADIDIGGGGEADHGGEGDGEGTVDDSPQWTERVAAVHADMEALRAALRRHAAAGEREHERLLFGVLVRCGTVAVAEHDDGDDSSINTGEASTAGGATAETAERRRHAERWYLGELLFTLVELAANTADGAEGEARAAAALGQGGPQRPPAVTFSAAALDADAVDGGRGGGAEAARLVRLARERTHRFAYCMWPRLLFARHPAQPVKPPPNATTQI
jgi:hypothetical protein